MDFIRSLLNIILLPLTLIAMCLLLVPYWVFKISSFVVRSLLPENVEGKVVLITGASSGIGEHVAYEYAKRRARLALVARRNDRLLGVAEKARNLGSPDTLVISADISKPENCDHIVHQTINHFGRVDHLVNNAGVTSSKLLDEYSDYNEMNSIMDINFWGAVNTTRFAMAHLRKSRGKIVVMSSAGYSIQFPRISIYSGSKAALMSVFETLRLELKGEVQITIVCPGVIESEMTTITENQSAKDEGWINFLKSSRFPVEKVERCAEAIVKSVCRGDRYLTEPNWVLAPHCIKLMCPELLEYFIQRFMKNYNK